MCAVLCMPVCVHCVVCVVVVVGVAVEVAAVWTQHTLQRLEAQRQTCISWRLDCFSSVDRVDNS